jgi:hypothetical protein
MPTNSTKAFKPDFTTEWAADQEVINGLGQLRAESTVVVILKTMSASPFSRPAPFLQDKPNKHTTLVGDLDFP